MTGIARNLAAGDRTIKIQAAAVEFSRRRAAGEDVDPFAFAEEHPDIACSLVCYIGIDDDGLANTPWPRVGDELFGYLVKDALGGGASGRAYLVADLDLDRLGVLKVLPRGDGEARQITRLGEHPHIVPVRRSHEDAFFAAFEMPWLGRATLLHTIEAVFSTGRPTKAQDLFDAVQSINGPSSSVPPADEESYVDRVVMIGAKLADALAFAHRRLVHRDVKPSNILLTDRLDPHLLDFDLADELGRDLTTNVKLGGTLNYASPEQLQSFLQVHEHDIGPTTDVFSFGCVLYELLSGERPFGDIEAGETIKETIGLRLDRLSQGATLALAGSPELHKIVATCLHFDVRERYQSAGRVARDLNALLRRSRFSDWWRKWRTWLLTGIAVTGIVAATVIASRDAVDVRHHKLAAVAYEIGDHGGALIEINQAIAVERTPERLKLRGLIHSHLEEWTQAAGDFAAARKEGEPVAELFMLSGYAYAKGKHHNAARSDYAKAIFLGASPITANHNLAVECMRLNLLDDADRAIAAAHKAGEVLPMTHYVQSRVAMARAAATRQPPTEEGLTASALAVDTCDPFGELFYVRGRLHAMSFSQSGDAAHRREAITGLAEAIRHGYDSQNVMRAAAAARLTDDVQRASRRLPQLEGTTVSVPLLERPY